MAEDASGRQRPTTSNPTTTDNPAVSPAPSHPATLSSLTMQLCAASSFCARPFNNCFFSLLQWPTLLHRRRRRGWWALTRGQSSRGRFDADPLLIVIAGSTAGCRRSDGSSFALAPHSHILPVKPFVHCQDSNKNQGKPRELSVVPFTRAMGSSPRPIQTLTAAKTVVPLGFPSWAVFGAPPVGHDISLAVLVVLFFDVFCCSSPVSSLHNSATTLCLLCPSKHLGNNSATLINSIRPLRFPSQTTKACFHRDHHSSNLLQIFRWTTFKAWPTREKAISVQSSKMEQLQA
ncbi:hypothetical protein HDK90DRAFT_328548 [Phyllosticta capitalensis]|uniref:Uncharacterized protein n=1 Tax=Phyllosticta capitalensis TaxID=121624 RepID=A0ABR1YI81_9PEZI